MGASFSTVVDPTELASVFFARVGVRPRVYRAPGRINLIGEHTDYNKGFALPAAIDRYCYVACAPNDAARLRVVSRNLGETAELSARAFAREGKWSDYVGAVSGALRDAGYPVAGSDIWIDSEVPPGAGISSSAALEVAIATALLSETQRPFAPETVARLAWAAETKYVGVRCGTMDQIASVFGQAGHALLVDFDKETTVAVAMPQSIAVIVIDSGVTHAHVSGGYAARRTECDTAAMLLGIRSLRDADEAALSDQRLSPVLRDRVRHVLSENARVMTTVCAMEAGDVATVGRTMRLSHESLRVDFDATCPETDLLTQLACDAPGIWGARQMGGGFGGAVIALAQSETASQSAQSVSAAYTERTGKPAPWFACTLAGGSQEVVL